MERPFPTFKHRLGNRKRIVLLLSTADVCRSPMAAGLLRRMFEERKITNVEIRPAGVLTAPGFLPSQEAIQIMEAEGIDITRHRSTQVTPDMVRKADLVLGMTPFHIQKALKMCREARGKSFLLKEYVDYDPENIQIPDPMGSTLEIFKKCFKDIRDACLRFTQSEFVQGARRAAARYEAAQEEAERQEAEDEADRLAAEQRLLDMVAEPPAAKKPRVRGGREAAKVKASVKAVKASAKRGAAASAKPAVKAKAGRADAKSKAATNGKAAVSSKSSSKAAQAKAKPARGGAAVKPTARPAKVAKSASSRASGKAAARKVAKPVSKAGAAKNSKTAGRATKPAPRGSAAKQGKATKPAAGVKSKPMARKPAAKPSTPKKPAAKPVIAKLAKPGSRSSVLAGRAARQHASAGAQRKAK